MSHKFVFVLLLLASILGHAKTIVIGSHGGIDATFNFYTHGRYYDPVSEHKNDPPGDESPLSEAVGKFENYCQKSTCRRDETPAYGVDASIIYFDENTNETIYSSIADRTGNPLAMYLFIKSTYETGDNIVVLGFSAGGNYALGLAHMLNLSGYPVHILGLIDATAGQNVYIPSNVKKVALYYQNKKVWGITTTNASRFFGENTSYYSGHPKYISTNDHRSIHYEKEVWKDFGTHMINMAPGTSDDDKRDDVPHKSDEQLVSEIANDPNLEYILGVRGEGSEDTYTDDPGDGETIWDGYAHMVGLKYVKAKWDDQSNYHSDLETYLGEIEDVDIRVKVKRKGGQWPSGEICAKAYLSGNRDFESSDVYLGKECHELSKDKYDDDDEVSFYIKNKDIEGLGKIDSAKKYWIFTIVERNGTVINSSTEEDGEERVGIVVAGHRPQGYVDALSCNDTVRGWARDYDRPYGGLDVHVYASDANGANKIYIDSIKANQYRSDLDGYFGWNWSIPGQFKKGSAKKFYFYGINEPDGNNPRLANGGNVNDTLTCYLCNNPSLTYDQCIAAIMTILD